MINISQVSNRQTEMAQIKSQVQANQMGMGSDKATADALAVTNMMDSSAAYNVSIGNNTSGYQTYNSQGDVASGIINKTLQYSSGNGNQYGMNAYNQSYDFNKSVLGSVYA